MDGASVGEAILAGALIFFVPGYGVTRATFPEWRVLFPPRRLRLLETVALSFVVSVALTVIAGEILLSTSPSGFQAYWTDPVLEMFLAAISVVAFLVAWARGAFREAPPDAYHLVATAPEEDPWMLMQELDRLERVRRRAMHRLRRSEAGSRESAQIQAEIDEIDSRRTKILREREQEYAS
ncbi:MAG: DUF1616 domain-containing protein [Candidatus Thermoplasmatota archaeon]|jgi:hypothetical protein|nr:DUF1616 domain-containing protein [Candidatus Thermoplasmatota archaeon]MCL5983145.1 DUF1616 domain-containing protein [Candidatus Thermoplasmatota archaeon]